MEILPWGEFRPDVTDFKGNNTRTILNVIPRGDGYGPVADLTVFTEALPAVCRGAFRALKNDGSVVIFAGTTTKLYKMENTDLSWTNVSKSDGMVDGAFDYALPAVNMWQFAQYSTFVVAVQPGNVPQVFDVSSDDFFSDLDADAPTATYVGIVNEFIVLTGLPDNPSRAQWCGRSDPTNWIAGTGESDFQDFPDGGSVGPIAGGEHSAIILQASVMRQMTYQPGSPVIFSFDKISEEIGIVAPYSLIKSGGSTFWMSNAGFQKSVNGAAPQAIGKERVDRTFLAEWDDNQPQLMMGTPDPRGTRIFWAYKTTSSENTDIFDKILCFDWLLDRWSPITGIQAEFIGSLAQVGVTLEGLDDTGFDLDDLPISLDAFVAAFGKEIAAFDADHKMGFLRGDALEAILETPEQGEPSSQQFVSGHRPICDAPSVFGQVSSRQKLSDAPVYNAEAEMDAAGLIPARTDTRYARHRNRIPASTVWSFSAGVEPLSVKTGAR